MKLSVSTLLAGILVLGTSNHGLSADEKAKVTFIDDVLPILENRCNNCHNPDEAKGGLNLATFSATLTGGSGGEIVISEDPGSSRLFTLAAHTEEPIMPPKGTKMTEKELKIVSDWIAGGLLETKNSKARKSDKPKVDLNSISATGKPEGPPAMPEHLILEPEVLTDRPNAVPAIAHSPWAPIVAVAGQKQVLLYHSEDYDLLGVLPYPEGFPQTLNFSPNGAYLSCGGGRAGKSGNVVAWDIKTGERILEVGKEYDIVLGADVSPDLKNAILGGPKRLIKLWDTVSGEEINSIKKHPDWMMTAQYSPDGILFATGGRNSGLYVWEAATGYEFYTLKGHTKAVTSLDWRSDGNVLATCSEDGQIILWEMNEGKQVKKWNAHSGGALAVTFAPNGNLASVGRDKTVKIWQADGKQLHSITASDDIVMSVAVSQDNKRVFTGDWHGNIKVWDTATAAQIAEIKPNPPTIEEQLAYSEQRIRELTGELPKLEQGVAAVSKELSDAKHALAAVDKSVAEATKIRDSHKGAAASHDAKMKALAPQVEATQKVLTAKQAATKVQTDALNAANAAIKPAQDAVSATTNDHKAKEAAFQAALAALNATKIEATKPALEAAHKTQHDQLAAARAAAENAKKATDAAVAAKGGARAPLVAALDQARKAATAANAQVAPAKTAQTNAETNLRNATTARVKADADLAAASKDGQVPPPNLVAVQQAAATAEKNAANAVNAAKTKVAAVDAAAKNAANIVVQADAKVKAVDAEIAKLAADQKAKNDAFAKAEAAFKPLRDALAAGNARIVKAKADLAAKTTAYQQSEKARNDAKAKLDAANQVFATATANLNQIKPLLAKAQAEEKAAHNALTAKRTEWTTAKDSLAASQAALAKAEPVLAGAAKQKEAAAAKVAAIVKKEAETKKTIDVAKAELESSKFLVKKWQAAAINLTAKKESEELDDMTEELEDMKEKEGEKKTVVTEATKARTDAEKTLAVAKKTVEEGNKKLVENSTSVLESALQLVASRAVAELKEEAVDAQPSAAKSGPDSPLVASADPDASSEPFAQSDMPDEAETEETIETVAAEALAYKSREEIDQEVEALRKRLVEIENLLAISYSEADKTKETVVKADKVAMEAPKVIAERTKAEQEAARLLAEAEAERKLQETALAEQQKHIEELRKKYLATVPKREE